DWTRDLALLIFRELLPAGGRDERIMRVEIGGDTFGDGGLQTTVEVVLDGLCGLVDGWQLAEERFLGENVCKGTTTLREVRVEVGFGGENRQSRERGPRALDIPKRRLGQAARELRDALDCILQELVCGGEGR